MLWTYLTEHIAALGIGTHDLIGTQGWNKSSRKTV
jgi:hypothetical protein